MSRPVLRRSVFAAAGLAALAFGGLFAARLAADANPDGGASLGPEGASRPERFFERMARRLELTDAQRDQVRQILRAHAEEIEAQLSAGAEARRAVKDAVHADPVDEAAIRERAAEFGRVHGEGAILMARIRAEVLPVLTEDQKVKLETLHEKMRGKGRRRAREYSEWLRGES
jgi:protein CpxP